jgi:hypothetical protein
MGRSINQTEERSALASLSSRAVFGDSRQNPAPSKDFPGSSQVRRKRQSNCLCLAVKPILGAARCFAFVLLASGAIWAAEPVESVPAPTPPALRTEVVPLESGAKLITFFEPLPDELAKTL